MAKVRFITIVAAIILLAPGCEEQQLERIDRIVKDANDVVSGVGAVLESPAGALLPPNLQLYGAIAVAIASVGVNAWQKVKGNLMKKTTKAIVKGIELADKPKTNPMTTVKKSIKAEMELAGILDKGNQLVDKLKVAR